MPQFINLLLVKLYTKAIKLLETMGFDALRLTRIEILMHPKKIRSEHVAIKCRYKKEGTVRKAIMLNNEMCNCLLYAKVI
jgi:[ribosomal protein S5]-alanine N-acetyltransferase